MNDTTKQQIESLLSASVAAYDEIAGSPFSQVWRVQLSGKHKYPDSVIIKQITYHTFMRVDGSLNQFIRESAALTFIQSRFDSDDAPAPKIYAQDKQNKIIIMQDFPDALSLDKVLPGDDTATAKTAIVASGKSLGQIHARTYGQDAAFRQLYNPDDTIPYHNFQFDEGWRLLCQFAGIKAPSHLDRAASQVTASLQNMPPDNVLVHKDPCPDNLLWINDSVKVIDFQNAHFGNPAFDICYIRGHFPSCWCTGRILPEVITRFETAYRDAFAHAFPAIQDDAVFYPMVIDGLAYMLGYTAHWIGQMAVDDWKHPNPGIASGRQRLLYRLHTFSELTKHYQHHQSFGEIAAMLCDKFGELWQISPDDMQYYPAFGS